MTDKERLDLDEIEAKAKRDQEKKEAWKRASHCLDLNSIEQLCLIEWDEKSLGMMVPFFLAYQQLITPALVARVRELEKALEATT